MASRCSQHKALKPRTSFWLRALVVSLLLLLSVADTARLMEEEVGGNAIFRCPVDINKSIYFLYLQKGGAFVNGFHTRRTQAEMPGPWANTAVNGTNVIMYNLSISSTGAYTCLIMYTGETKHETHVIHLNVTARYTTPEVTVVCTGDNRSCLVRCEARGGYPATKIKWNDGGSWEVLNNIERDPHTLRFNSISNANYSCSNGPLHSLSCSVGNLTSKPFSVCTPKDPHNPDDRSNTVLISAVVVSTVVFICSMAAFLYWKCKKRGREGDVQRGASGEPKAEESIALSVNGGVEAS